MVVRDFALESLVIAEVFTEDYRQCTVEAVAVVWHIDHFIVSCIEFWCCRLFLLLFLLLLLLVAAFPFLVMIALRLIGIWLSRLFLVVAFGGVFLLIRPLCFRRRVFFISIAAFLLVFSRFALMLFLALIVGLVTLPFLVSFPLALLLSLPFDSLASVGTFRAVLCCGQVLLTLTGDLRPELLAKHVCKLT